MASELTDRTETLLTFMADVGLVSVLDGRGGSGEGRGRTTSVESFGLTRQETVGGRLTVDCPWRSSLDEDRSCQRNEKLLVSQMQTGAHPSRQLAIASDPSASVTS